MTNAADFSGLRAALHTITEVQMVMQGTGNLSHCLSPATPVGHVPFGGSTAFDVVVKITLVASV